VRIQRLASKHTGLSNDLHRGHCQSLPNARCTSP